MKTHAAVLWGRQQDWQIEEIDLDPPREHEVLVKWAAAGLCHSDEHIRPQRYGRQPDSARSARDALVPHRGRARGRRRRPPRRAGRAQPRGGRPRGGELLSDLRSLQDVHQRATRTCATSARRRSPPGRSSDGTVRYHHKGQDLNVMAKLGTFAEHSVVHEASLVKVDNDLPLSVVALVSCGVTTGWGSAVYRAEVEAGETRSSSSASAASASTPSRAPGMVGSEERRRRGPDRVQTEDGPRLRRHPHGRIDGGGPSSGHRADPRTDGRCGHPRPERDVRGSDGGGAPAHRQGRHVCRHRYRAPVARRSAASICSSWRCGRRRSGASSSAPPTRGSTSRTSWGCTKPVSSSWTS